MLTKTYLEALLSNFNKKTGLQININEFYNDLILINDDKESSNEKASLFQDAYEMTFHRLIATYKYYFNHNNAPEVKDNFMQEFDAMMNHIYVECCNGIENPNITFNYGYVSSTGRGLDTRNYEFSKYFNKATDIEQDLKNKNEYNDDKIVENLKIHTDRFNPDEYNSNFEVEGNSTKLQDLTSNLKVARNHYKNKFFLARWFSFSERKAINNAKAKIRTVLERSNRKINEEDINRFIDSSIPASEKCKKLVDSLNNTKKVDTVTDYESFKERFKERQNKNLNDEKEVEQEEVINQEPKKEKYSINTQTNKIVILDKHDYHDFLRKNNYTKDNSTEEIRHNAYAKYCDSLDIKDTSEQIAIDDNEVGQDINTNLNINDIINTNNRNINKEVKENKDDEIIISND